MKFLPSTSGPVAQLGARFHGMEEVVGSIPTRSTKSLHGLAPIAILIPKFFPVISYLCCQSLLVLTTRPARYCAANVLIRSVGETTKITCEISLPF